VFHFQTNTLSCIRVDGCAKVSFDKLSFDKLSFDKLSFESSK